MWNRVDRRLASAGYTRATRSEHRTILRGFKRFVAGTRGGINRQTVRDYVCSLSSAGASWSWVGMNMSGLRNMFDKVGGLSVTAGLRTPRRPHALPEILAPNEVERILNAASTPRDRLLLGLLHGCGLKVGEVCALRWRHVQTESACLTIEFAAQTRHRHLVLPPELIPLLAAGVRSCSPDDYVFQGRKTGTPLSTRAAESVVRSAHHASGVRKPVTAMTLRHSYAVHCLEQGWSIRALQEALGHRSIETTLLYQRCILPDDAVSPITRVYAAMHKTPAPSQPSTPPPPSVLDAAHAALTLVSTAQAPSTTFYQLLRTRLRDRFLALTRAIGPP